MTHQTLSTTTTDTLEHHLTQLAHLSSALDLIADGIEFGEYKDHHMANAVRGVSEGVREEIRALRKISKELVQK